MKLRGQGDLFGTMQSGEKVFVLADIYEDASILEAAAKEAKEYSLEKLFSEKVDEEDAKDKKAKHSSYQDMKTQNMRLQKKVSRYMGEVTL